jgi:hypothetical protein
LEITVSTGKGLNKHSGLVNVYGFDKFTPRAARAALEIAGNYTGTAAYQETSPDGEYTYYSAYRIYKNSARKICDVG